MIQAGDLTVKLEKDGPAHVRISVLKEQPAGHLPRKLAEVAIAREQLIDELRAAGVIE